MKKILFCFGLFIAGFNISYAQSAQTLSADSKEITRGNNVVATYTRHETRLENDNVEMEMTFKANDGSIIAVATIPYQRKEATIIKTPADGKKHSLILSGKMDVEMAKEIANALAEQKYL